MLAPSNAAFDQLRLSVGQDLCANPDAIESIIEFSTASPMLDDGARLALPDDIGRAVIVEVAGRNRDLDLGREPPEPGGSLFGLL